MFIDADVVESGAKVTVPVKVVNPDVGLPVVVVIDRDTILAAGDSPTLPVNYDIIDAGGNYSKRSPITLVNVQASTTSFIAAKVLEASQLRVVGPAHMRGPSFQGPH